MSGRTSVAVCLVTRNRAQTLRDALASLTRQTVQPDEVIIVDNASEDETSGVASQSGALVLTLGKNIGCAPARNRAARASNADLLFFFDDDSILQDDAIERAVTVADANPSAVVLAPQIVENGAPRPAEVEETQACATFTGQCVVRREALSKFGGYPETFLYGGEEQDLGLRILDSGADIIFAPAIVVQHRPRAGARDVHQEVRAKLLNHVFVRWKYLPVTLATVSTLRTVALQAWWSAREGTLSAWVRATVAIPSTVTTAWRVRSPISQDAVRRYRLLRRHEELV
jgi:GT2 family glycosyltransferase